MGYYIFKGVIFYNAQLSKKKKKRIVRIRRKKFLRSKNKYKRKFIKKMKKTWSAFKKWKRKKTIRKLEGTNFWRGCFFHMTIFKNYKFNKKIKMLKKSKHYDNTYFTNNWQQKKFNITNLSFESTEDDELFLYKKELFEIDYFLTFLQEDQFFVIGEFIAPIIKQNYIKLTQKVPIKNIIFNNVKFNTNFIFFLNNKNVTYLNINYKYKLNSWS
jgi:hypothetical protein